MSSRANIAVRQPTLREMMEFIAPTRSVGKHYEDVSAITGVSKRTLRDARRHEPISAKARAAITNAYVRACEIAEAKALEWELLNAALECNLADLASAAKTQSPSEDLPKAKTGIPRP